MSNEIQFKKEYQDTYNEVKAPGEFSQKILKLSKEENKKTKESFVKKLVTAAAVLFSIFVAGNGVAYAATGIGLLEKAKLYVNGVRYETDIEEKVDENGNIYYVADFKEAGEKITVSSGDLKILTEPDYQVIVTLKVNGLDVVEENEKLYLVNKFVKIDITEDLEDGLASGTYEKDGNTYEYKVKEIRLKDYKHYNINVKDVKYNNGEEKTPLT